MADVDLRRTLAHVAALERELQRVKRDLLQALPARPPASHPASLFGVLAGGEVTDEMIAEAKRSLFRDIDV